MHIPTGGMIPLAASSPVYPFLVHKKRHNILLELTSFRKSPSRFAGARDPFLVNAKIGLKRSNFSMLYVDKCGIRVTAVNCVKWRTAMESKVRGTWSSITWHIMEFIALSRRPCNTFTEDSAG